MKISAPSSLLFAGSVATFASAAQVSQKFGLLALDPKGATVGAVEVQPLEGRSDARNYTTSTLVVRPIDDSSPDTRFQLTDVYNVADSAVYDTIDDAYLDLGGFDNQEFRQTGRFAARTHSSDYANLDLGYEIDNFDNYTATGDFNYIRHAEVPHKFYFCDDSESFQTGQSIREQLFISTYNAETPSGCQDITLQFKAVYGSIEDNPCAFTHACDSH